MVVIPAGSFQMGSPATEDGRYEDEGPQHPVSIGYRFAIGKYEVTRAEYAQFVAETSQSAGDGCYSWTGSEWKKDANRSWRDPGFAQTERDPVVCVSWEDARAYAAWVSTKTGKIYRLPTEAEWEYAARAGEPAARPWGKDPNRACEYANVADKSAKSKFGWEGVHDCDDGFVYTAPVGSKKQNAFGLYDMLGNVWEWTEDCWHNKYDDAPKDGRAWVTGGDCGRRVARGGSWNNDPRGVRYGNLGFRLARTLP
jgi:formylglycine-generating enzyme required for sulfatase activity